MLTRTALNDLVSALEAVLEDPEVWTRARQRESLVDALKQADYLYPLVWAREQQAVVWNLLPLEETVDATA